MKGKIWTRKFLHTCIPLTVTVHLMRFIISFAVPHLLACISPQMNSSSQEYLLLYKVEKDGGKKLLLQAPTTVPQITPEHLCTPVLLLTTTLLSTWGLCATW